MVAEGSRVLISGLQSRKDLNGTSATVLHWVPEASRWAVECASGELVRVKPANLEPASEDSSSGQAMEEVASAADQCGSGETLASLGVDLRSVLPQARTIEVDAGVGDTVEGTPADLIDENWLNAKGMQCRYCGCSILPRGKVRFADRQMTMPMMPAARAARGEAGAPSSELVQGFWHVRDKFDFDNMGATKPAEGGVRYIICGECDMGPIGWFRDDKDMYVAIGRVTYKAR